MATPVGWSQGGSGSVCLAFDQLRDVIESQEELIHQLRNVVRSQKSWGKGWTGRLNGGVGLAPVPTPGGIRRAHCQWRHQKEGGPRCVIAGGNEAKKGQGSHEYLPGNFNHNQVVLYSLCLVMQSLVHISSFIH